MSDGFDPARLARIGRFLDERYVAPGRLAGVQVAVNRGGRPAYRLSLGAADRERGVEIADDTIFRIYSMTKPLTSVACLMLVEEGQVALDDPVERFLPEWRGLGVFAGGTRGTGFATTPAPPMRIVDLLRHTSGLTYGFQNRTNVDAAYRELGIGEIEKSGDLAAFVAALARLPLEFAPGTAWNYSVATDVVGHLVGLIAGEPFETFLQRRVLDVVGMPDTGFAVAPGSHARLAACYAPGRDSALVLQDDPATSSFLATPTFVSGGGGLVSTTADYIAFAEALRTGVAASGERLLGRKTLALMTANHLPGGVDLPALSRSLFSEAAYDGVGFGLGVAVTTDPARTLLPGSRGEYFWGGAASTFFWIDPAEDLTCVFMTQLLPSSTYPIRRELRTLVYSALD